VIVPHVIVPLVAVHQALWLMLPQLCVGTINNLDHLL